MQLFTRQKFALAFSVVKTAVEYDCEALAEEIGSTDIALATASVKTTFFNKFFMLFPSKFMIYSV